MTFAQPVTALDEPICFTRETPDAFTQIYQDACQLALWQRPVPAGAAGYINALTQQQLHINVRQLLPVTRVTETLSAVLPKLAGYEDFVADVQQLADMFACLFELNYLGLRLASLQTAMCPSFHVDQVPCRLVTTYQGPGTHWLNTKQRRFLLEGNTEANSQQPTHWQQLAVGEVALLKGEGWQDNMGRGLWHRSPPVPIGERRLFLSLDMAE
ncbi:DUF1826 domain-containing protein [Oceanisphaera sp. IT1-181]|uniref:DUF1826 domain-containing protein n=1 Tax=Oceanisphaera sp. IT1-181 TaxID=3081199 RepID=UPI0029C9D2A9|nr:DUF1826 domain-containing protein [Oceanisphaera sp. IT1-181]